MRAFGGIAGLLVVIGVIVWWLGAPGGQLEHDMAAIKAGDKARDEISQMAGRDTATGGRAWDSAVVEMLFSGGKPASLQVTSVVSGGAYDHYFGLMKGDVITAVEYQGYKKPVREMDDAQYGKEQVSEAFQRHGTLTIRREGKEMVLPAPTAMTTPAAPANPSSPAAADAAPPQPKKNSLQNQLDQIQNSGAR